MSSGSSGSATTRGYYVQARCIEDRHAPGWGIHGPPRNGDQYIGNEWGRLVFHKDPYGRGVKNDHWDVVAEHNNILTYYAAKALMAMVAANNRDHYRLEFRLVKVKCKSSYEITEEGFGVPESFGFEVERKIEFTPDPGESDDG